MGDTIMAITINADTSNGLKLTSDTSGQIDFQSAGSTKALIDTSGNLKFNSGYGSVVTGFGVRAWISLNGTSTIAILNSGNVSSITDNGTGDYTITFAAAMPDANYVMGNAMLNANGGYIASIESASNKAVGSCRIKSHRVTNSFADLAVIDLTFTR